MIHRVFRPRFSSSRDETIWLTIYADLITNLMLLFLALFGLTLIGESALRDALLSMRFGDLVFKKLENEKIQFESTVENITARLSAIDGVDVREEMGAVRLSFGEDILFSSGRAELKKSARPILEQLSSLLKDVPYTLVVEGHTDDVPIGRHSPFKTNWELSLGRSMSVVRSLIESGLPASHIAAAAYGPYHPRSPNTSDAERRLNRRVEISLYRDFSL